MTEESIFKADQAEAAPNQEQASSEATPVSTPTSSIPPELAELVGEGKKWRDLSEAQKSIPHAQAHIAKLEAELAAAREEGVKNRTAQELLEEIRNSSTEQQKPTSQGVEVNEAVLSEIVEKKLLQQSQRQSQESNAKQVVNAFSNSFGDKAEEMYDKLAKENGFTRAEFNAFASTKPQAVLKLAGLSQAAPKTTASLTSDVNTIGISSRNTEQPINAKVVNYGSSKDIADAMRRAKEMVNKRLSS